MSSIAVELGRYAGQRNYGKPVALKEEKSSLLKRIAGGVKDWVTDPYFWNVYDALRTQDTHQRNALYESWR